MSVSENMTVRDALDTVLGLAADEIELLLVSKEGCDRFWRVLAASAADRVSKKRRPALPVPVGSPTRKLTDKQARSFGRTLVPFGEFAGKPVDDVPLERLHWYADQTFVDDLRRYLDSDRVGREFV